MEWLREISSSQNSVKIFFYMFILRKPFLWIFVCGSRLVYLEAIQVYTLAMVNESLVRIYLNTDLIWESNFSTYLRTTVFDKKEK